jgi:S1-C subfamily serine protease
MGFAIPINTVKRVMGEILREGRVIRPQLGISGISLTPEISSRYGIKAKSGVFIVRVNEGSQAEKSGLREGDVITEFGGTRIENMKNLLEELVKGKLGDRKELSIVRRGREYKTTVRLMESGDIPRLRVVR